MRALLGALFPTAPATAKAAEVGLWLLTDTKRADRDAIVEALIATGLQTVDCDWLDANASRIAAYGLPIFELTPFGWDVHRAAVHDKDPGRG
jgi:hypothetical protein